MFFEILELNSIRLGDRDKARIFKQYGVGTNINERYQAAHSTRNAAGGPNDGLKNEIRYKEALAQLYINMEEMEPL